MNHLKRKILLLINDSGEYFRNPDAYFSILTESDKMLLALWQQEGSASWPFKVYEPGWNLLKDEQLLPKLSALQPMRRCRTAQCLEASTFLDLVMMTAREYTALEGNPVTKAFTGMINCPLLLIDETQRGFQEILLSYNGSVESFRSIKIFLYLFREQMDALSLNLIIKVNDDALNMENCVYDYLRLYKRHFAISRFFEDDYDNGVESLLAQSQSPLIITGGDRALQMAEYRNFVAYEANPCSLFLL